MADQDPTPEEQGEQAATVTIRLGPGSYAAACASLSHLFTECGLDKEFCENSRYLWKNLSLYNKGARRTGARERHALGMRTVEGKDPIPLAAYTYLANVLIKSDDPEHVAAHLFLLLEWNLISRADMVINANIDLVGMYNDSLCFQVGPSKGDQEGSKHQDHPFHVYSVPQNPAICPVLAFCKHLLCNPRILSGKCKLFDGANQYERFNNILRGIVTSDEHRQALIDLQMPPNYFGTHSLRKGAVTHVACGTTSSPPIVSICIRANWAMPGVMSRYIRYEAAGDMYVGRSVCGRHRLEKEFAESIPYFDFSEFSGEDKEEKRREEKWMPGFVSACRRKVATMMLFFACSRLALPLLCTTVNFWMVCYIQRMPFAVRYSGLRRSLMRIMLLLVFHGTGHLIPQRFLVYPLMCCTCQRSRHYLSRFLS
jgi:hypothetical protein